MERILGRRTVDALRFLRSQNVIHRDIKPQVGLAVCGPSSPLVTS